MTAVTLFQYDEGGYDDDAFAHFRFLEGEANGGPPRATWSDREIVPLMRLDRDVLIRDVWPMHGPLAPLPHDIHREFVLCEGTRGADQPQPLYHWCGHGVGEIDGLPWRHWCSERCRLQRNAEMFFNLVHFHLIHGHGP